MFNIRKTTILSARLVTLFVRPECFQRCICFVRLTLVDCEIFSLFLLKMVCFTHIFCVHFSQLSRSFFSVISFVLNRRFADRETLHLFYSFLIVPTTKNNVIAQSRIAQNYAETVPFRKFSTPGNQVILRYFSQCPAMCMALKYLLFDLNSIE